MIRVQEALDLVLNNVSRQATLTVPLAEACGRILGEDVFSDMKMPPFHRSMMDGYALDAQDAQFAPARLQVVGFIPAGSYPKFKLEPGQAAKIMTGAPLPGGANAVIPVEKTRSHQNGTQVELLEPVKSWQHVVKQGSEVGEGEIVLSAGTFLQPAAIGLLAAVGKAQVSIIRAPQIAILATGDELVEPHNKPLQGQIRNSNTWTLQALCQSMRITPHLLGIAKDDELSLRNKIQQGMQSDVLLVTGGVSMGDHDFVKDIFHELDCEIVFDKIAIKPGKPTVFAKQGEKVIFGLPGNPVSCATVFEILVRPALRKMMGFPMYTNATVQATLTKYFSNTSKRENFHPCITWYEDGQFFCRPLETKGSGDIVAFARSNSYLRCPAEVTDILEDSRVIVVLRDEYYLN